MTTIRSIPTYYRNCLDCPRTIPAHSDEMRCPGCKAKHAKRTPPPFPPHLTNGVEADIVIVGNWIKILTARGLRWARGYGADLPSGCDLLSVFRIADPTYDAARARRDGLVVVVERALAL
jgi:hypothetical protein